MLLAPRSLLFNCVLVVVVNLTKSPVTVAEMYLYRVSYLPA